MAAWGLVVAVLLALAAWGWYENHGNSEAHDLRDQLLTANTNEDLLNLLPQMAPYRRWLDPLLRETYAQAETDNVRRKQLLASLALLPVDASQVAYLNGRVLDAGPDELRMILDALAPHKDALQVEKSARGDRPESASRCGGAGQGDPGKAKGECGSGPLEDESAGRCLATAQARRRSQGADLLDSPPRRAWRRRKRRHPPSR